MTGTAGAARAAFSIGLLLLAAASGAADTPAATLATVTAAPAPACTATSRPVGSRCLDEALLQRYERYGQEMAAALTARDVAAFNRGIDFTAFEDRIMAGVTGMPAAARRDFANGLRAGLAGSSQQLVDSMMAGSTVRFLRVREVAAVEGPRLTALLRLDGEDDTVNYIDLYLVDGRDPAQLDDVLMHSRGLRASTLMSGMVSLLLQPAPGDDGRALLAFFGAYRAARFREAESLYWQLPEPVKNQPLVGNLLAEAAMMAGDAEYSMALREIAARHAHSGVFALRLIDFHIEAQDYPAALASLDAMELAVGADATIDMHRAAVYTLMRQWPEVVDYCGRVIAVEPERESPWWLLLNALVELQRFEEAVLTLQIVEERLQVQITDEVLRGDSGLDALADSQPFRDWQAGRAKPADDGAGKERRK